MKLSLISLLPWTGMAFAFTIPEPRSQGFDRWTPLSSALDKRQFDYSVTRNELGECKPVTVIFARGTIELGNVGSTTGPPFFNALDVIMGADNLAVQGVNYPATILGYLGGGDKGGAQKLADLTQQAARQCPDTRIVLSGYSQGAQVVHLGEAKMSPETASRVAAVVLFGDPKKGQALQKIDKSKVKTFCFIADLICDALPVVGAHHLSYAANAVAAAKFVADQVSL
ncbi:MAG: hypothetical protein Q9163_003018 [Psora crenata]